MEQTMELSHEQLESIGRYVRGNLSAWIGEVYTPRDIQLSERMVRLEEELKGQRELMQQGFALMEKRFEQVDKRFEQVDKRFEQVDKRFEQVDKRFESIDKRFEDMHRFSNRWFMVISLMLGIITLGVGILGYLGLS